MHPAKDQLLILSVFLQNYNFCRIELENKLMFKYLYPVTPSKSFNYFINS